jgi:hypothetical protein
MQSQAGSTNFRINSVSASKFDLFINNCVSTAPCLSQGIDAGCSGALCNNTQNYYERVFTVGGNTAMKFVGTTTTGSGAVGPANAAVTNNYYGMLRLLNPTTTFMDFSIGCDSLFIQWVYMQGGSTISPGVVFNSASPNATQDVNGITIRDWDFNMTSPAGTGVLLNTSSSISLRSALGLSSWPGATQFVVGCTPVATCALYSLQLDAQAGSTALPFGFNNSYHNTGTISAGIAPATGMAAGDFSASRSATTGAMYIGSDGGSYLYRDGTNLNLNVPTGKQVIVEANGSTTNGNLVDAIHTFPEQAAPTANANQDICYGDSTAHALKCSYNNGTFYGVPLLGTANTWTGVQSFSANTLVPSAVNTTTVGTNALPFTSVYIGTAATNNIQLTGTGSTAKTATLPDNTGTVAELNLAQTWTAVQSFSSGNLKPTSAGGTDVGATALPFGNLWIGTAATNNFKFQPAATGGARIINMADFGANGPTTQNHPFETILTSQYTNSTTTMSNVTGGNTLQFAVLANTTYVADCHLYYQAASTGGLNIQFTGPASPTTIIYGLNLPVSATANAGNGVATAFGTSLGAVVTTAATNFDAEVSLALINGSNAGTVTLQAKSSAAVQLQIQAGSYCKIQ